MHRESATALSAVPGWEHAVESVLGDRLQAVHVDSIDAYAHQLKSLERGLVTLVDGGHVASGQPRSAIAVELRASRVPLGSLLNGVYAAQTLSAALDHRAQTRRRREHHHARRYLARRPDWLRLDRGEDIGRGIIERGQQLDALRERTEGAELNLTELQGRVAAGRARVEELDRQPPRTAGHDQSARADARAIAHGPWRAPRAARRSRRATRTVAPRERRHRPAGRGRSRSASTSPANALTMPNVRAKRYEADRATLPRGARREHPAVEQARQQARADRDAFHAVNGEKQNLESRLEATETARQRLLRQQEELTLRHAELNAGVESSQGPLPNLRTDLEGKLADRLAVDHLLTQVRRALETADAAGARARRQARRTRAGGR